MRRKGLALPVVLLLCACRGADERSLPSATPVWESPVRVGDAGRGYYPGVRDVVLGGPRHISVDASGNAHLAWLHAERESTLVGRYTAWASAYVDGQGWTQPARLTEGAGTENDSPRGLGLTPDGALFGWSGTRPTAAHDSIGLRGYHLRNGWQPPGTLLEAPGHASMLTDASGIPSVVYNLDGGTWFVRHSGVLQGPELVVAGQTATAFAADGIGGLAVATAGGTVAIRSVDGRWSHTTIPNIAALVGRPEGGFAVCLLDWTDTRLTYSAGRLDSSGHLGPLTTLGGAIPPLVDPLFGRAYDPLPKMAAGAGGALAVGWHAGSSLSFSRQIGDTWEPLETRPASGGGSARLGATRPFDLAVDRSGKLLVAWVTAGGLVSAQWEQGKDPSSDSPIASSAADILLAVNPDGIAFAVWRDGEHVIAARSAPPHR